MIPYTLALDCGSTHFKAALFDESLHRLAEAKLPVQSLAYRTDRIELGAEEIWQSTLELIRLTCQQAGLDTSQVAQFSITSQAQTFLLVDETGAPITPLISWLDSRAKALVPQLQHALGKDFAHHCSFASPLAELQLAKLLWLRKHSPELVDRARLIAPLPTWLTLRLGGVAAIDDNIAAMSGLYSLHTRGYWRSALELCGVPESKLPGLVKAGTPIWVNQACPELALSPQTVIILAGNDQTCGAYGNGCRAGVADKEHPWADKEHPWADKEHPWIATLGTALVVYRLAGPTPGPYHPSGCWGPYPGGGYYELAVQNYGCAALDWALKILFPGQELTAFFSSAQSIAANWQAVPPFFYPDQMGSPSAWVGVGSQPERAMAVLEGIGFNLRRLVFDELDAGESVESGFEKLIVTGGGSRNDFWMQLLADILDVPIQRGFGDGLLGAAWLASPDVKPPQNFKPQTWLPDIAKVAFYRDQYEQWCKCHRIIN